MARTTLPRSFHRLFAASTASNLADGLLLVGAPLLALRLTRDPVAISGLQAAVTLPWLLTALHAGVLADRHDRRTLLLLAALARGGVLVAAGAALALRALPLAGLYLVVFTVGVGEVLFDTTSQSVLPDLVDRDDLAAANGRLIGGQVVANHFLGAPLAGVLVTVLASAVLLGPALLFLGVAVVLLGLPRRGAPARSAGTSMGQEIRTGVRFLWHEPTLRALALLGCALNLGNAAYFGVFVLFVVGDDAPMGLPEVGFGALAALLATGSIVGSLVAERLERQFGPRRVLLVAAVGISLLMLTPVVTAAPAPVGLMALLLGTGSVLVNVVSVSSRQRIVPAHLLGRVNASFRLVGIGAMPAGALLGGVMAGAAGLRTLFAGAVAVQLVALAVWQRPITDVRLRAATELSERPVSTGPAPRQGGGTTHDEDPRGRPQNP